MGNPLKRWLDCDEMPVSFYEVVGHPILCSDSEELRTAIRRAYEFFKKYETHRNVNTQDRAVALMRLLSDASVAIADRRRWREYNERIVQPLRREFERKAENGEAPTTLLDLRRWLIHVKGVDPRHAGTLAESWLTAASARGTDSRGPADTPKGQRSLPDQVGSATPSSIVQPQPAASKSDNELPAPRDSSLISSKRVLLRDDYKLEVAPEDDGLAGPAESNTSSEVVRSGKSSSRRPPSRAPKPPRARSRSEHVDVVPDPQPSAVNTDRPKPTDSGAIPFLTPPPSPKQIEKPKIPSAPRQTPSRPVAVPVAGEGSESQNTTLWMIVIFLASAAIVSVIGVVLAVAMGVFDTPPPEQQDAQQSELQQPDSQQTENQPVESLEPAPKTADPAPASGTPTPESEHQQLDGSENALRPSYPPARMIQVTG